MTPAEDWRFAALGKHPGAGDYIYLGEEFGLAGAMGSWLGKAFDAGIIDPDRMRAEAGAVFWTTGSADGDLACGLLAPSWDSVGRSYPLLLLGTGPLESWKRHWDLLPVALSATWQAMRELAYGRKGAVDYLQRKVETLPRPQRGWLQLSAARRERLEKKGGKLPRTAPDARAKQTLLNHGVLAMQTAHERGEDVIWLWHTALKKWAGGALAPRAGLAWWDERQVRLLLLRRPMVPADMKAMLYATDIKECLWT